MTTIVRGVEPGDIDEIWPLVAPLIARALAKGDGRFGIEEVLNSLREARRQLWITCPKVECALVTQIDVYPRRKVFRAFAIGGRLPPDWQQIWSDIEGLAAEQGCTACEIEGRKGWLRRLAGYRSPKVLLRKELQHA